MFNIKYCFFYIWLLFYCCISSATTYVAEKIPLTIQNMKKEKLSVNVENSLFWPDNDTVLVSIRTPKEKKYVSFPEVWLIAYQNEKIGLSVPIREKADEKGVYSFSVECQRVKYIRVHIRYKGVNTNRVKLIYEIKSLWEYNPALKEKMRECR